MHDPLTPLFVRAHTAYLHHVDSHPQARRHLDRHRQARLAGPEPALSRRSDHGQATTEYALVLLAAALIGLLAVGWATAGGGAGKIGKLFDRVIDSVIDRV